MIYQTNDQSKRINIIKQILLLRIQLYSKSRILCTLLMYTVLYLLPSIQKHAINLFVCQFSNQAFHITVKLAVGIRTLVGGSDAQLLISYMLCTQQYSQPHTRNAHINILCTHISAFFSLHILLFETGHNKSKSQIISSELQVSALTFGCQCRLKFIQT